MENWEELGELMNQNHALLQEMTVSSPELDRLVNACKQSRRVGCEAIRRRTRRQHDRIGQA